uniref:BZIP domain-containing protein n=1 Tax=Strongyloides venezuelensis TaxID=75913 RepID=A0A0K0F6R1_STRVS
MKSIKLVFVLLFLFNLFLAGSFESKSDLVSNDIESICNLRQPAILNDEEDINSNEKRQSKSRKGRSRKSRLKKMKNKNKKLNEIIQEITEIQLQLGSIATRLYSFTTTANPNGQV